MAESRRKKRKEAIRRYEAIVAEANDAESRMSKANEEYEAAQKARAEIFDKLRDAHWKLHVALGGIKPGSYAPKRGQ